MSVYKDFVPKVVVQGKGIFGKALTEYEHFDAAAEAAVAWIKSNEIQLLSIETVVLPGLPDAGNDNDAYSGSAGEYGTLYQFVRVWYLER